MKFVKKKTEHHIKGLLEYDIEPFTDFRGDIWSLYQLSEELPDFVEDKVSISKKNVLRGLHGDFHTSKLITCLYGKFFLAVVDIRKNSPTFNKSITFELSYDNPKLILVPSGCLNGHLSLSNECVFFYKWSEFYDGPEKQVTVKWDEPTYNIRWPIKKPILSDRDKNAKYL